MFDHEIKYQEGFTNVEANMLSRQPTWKTYTILYFFDLNEVSDNPKKGNLKVDGKKHTEISDVVVIKC